MERRRLERWRVFFARREPFVANPFFSSGKRRSPRLHGYRTSCHLRHVPTSIRSSHCTFFHTVVDFSSLTFSQNPPIDPIRESIVMSLECYVGCEGNLLEMNATQCHRLLLTSPVLTIEEINALKRLKDVHADWPARVIDITFAKSEGLPGKFLSPRTGESSLIDFFRRLSSCSRPNLCRS